MSTKRDKRNAKNDSEVKNSNNKGKNAKHSLEIPSDEKNGHIRSADYDELSTDYRPEGVDQEKYETFRRIASAEEIEELDTFHSSGDEHFDVTSDTYDLSKLSPEKRAKLEEEWRLQLAKTEEEIQTLRHVLSAKLRQAHDLKRRLGITAWKELRGDVEQGFKHIQETTAYQKTSSVFGSLGESVARKIGEVKKSNTFKTFEERVGTAVSNVKTKVTNSRLNANTNTVKSAQNSAESDDQKANTLGDVTQK